VFKRIDVSMTFDTNWPCH